jgi:peroxiredoxin
MLRVQIAAEYCAFYGVTETLSNLKVGDKALSFDLPGVDGRNHSLAQYSNKKAVAAIFSCNHCPYVRAWEDRMVKIQEDYANKGVQLIAINANDATKYPDDSFDKMKEHAHEKNFNFPYLRDESQKVAREYGAERTPEVFLFDRMGALRYHGVIDDNYDDPSAVKVHYLRNALDAVLSGSKAQTAETMPVGCTIKWK